VISGRERVYLLTEGEDNIQFYGFLCYWRGGRGAEVKTPIVLRCVRVVGGEATTWTGEVFPWGVVGKWMRSSGG
jgi:hypothetical protein